MDTLSSDSRNTAFYYSPSLYLRPYTPFRFTSHFEFWVNAIYFLRWWSHRLSHLHLEGLLGLRSKIELSSWRDGARLCRKTERRMSQCSIGPNLEKLTVERKKKKVFNIQCVLRSVFYIHIILRLVFLSRVALRSIAPSMPMATPPFNRLTLLHYLMPICSTNKANAYNKLYIFLLMSTL